MDKHIEKVINNLEGSKDSALSLGLKEEFFIYEYLIKKLKDIKNPSETDYTWNYKKEDSK